jgi:hypothetical protein
MGPGMVSTRAHEDLVGTRDGVRFERVTHFGLQLVDEFRRTDQVKPSQVKSSQVTHFGLQLVDEFRCPERVDARVHQPLVWIGRYTG